MAKRHQSLVPLSHDHHHGLALALRLRQGNTALLNDGWTHDLNAQADIVRKFYAAELSVHFRLEEEILFPAMQNAIPDSSPLIRSLIEQHRRMEEMIRQLHAGDHTDPAPLLVSLGTILEQHIRSEERELFVLYEARIPPELKQQLGDALQRRLEAITPVRDH